MTHRQRVEDTLALKETDRTPFSLWMHFPNRDRHPRRLAELTLGYQRRYDLDFIKFMPYGMYSTIDYGVDLDVYPGFLDAPTAYKPLIKEVTDWDKISYVKGTTGEFAIVLEAQRILFDMMDKRIPFLQTLFSPMTTAAKMCSPEVLARHIKENPQKVRRALEIFTAATIEFAKASIRLGADGFFWATQMSSTDILDEKTHDEFVKKYDMEVLNAVRNDTWFNVCHLHGPNTFIKSIQDYPVQALSWHDRDDGPSMDEVREYSTKAFMGGLSWGKNWLAKSKEDVVREVEEVISRHNGKGILLGPGCVIDPSTPLEYLELVQKTVMNKRHR